jgi:hypothetical protein
MAKDKELECSYKEVLRYGKIILDLRGEYDRSLFLEYNGFFVETYQLLGEVQSISTMTQRPPYWETLINDYEKNYKKGELLKFKI